MQTLAAFPPRQGPRLFDPCREALASGWELLAGGAPQDAGHAVPLWHPEARASQQGAAPLRAWVQTAAPVPLRLLRRYLKMEFSQPFGQHPKKPFRLLLQAAGTPPGIRISAPQCFSPTAWFHHFLKPQVEGVVQRHLGEDG